MGASPEILLTILLFAMSCVWAFPEVASAKHAGITRHYKFNIKLKNVTRLCHTKSMVTVNGRFPGPRIVAREGDRVVVKVVSHVPNNISIHWHGIRQLQSGWADGPSYITQCPIQTNQTYVYNFTITGQRGTLFWHAHISWLRASVYGSLIVFPKHNVSYPFAKPHKEVTIMLGEWFNADSEAVIRQALQTGGGPNVSDAYTFNGFPGPLYNCSANRKTYLLRLINAALNDELFFSIANHTFTVVEVDATYVKPFETSLLVITPGQTTNILLKTKPIAPNASFYMLARPYFTGQGTFDNTTGAGILEYETSSNSTTFTPTLPPINATNVVANFTRKLRSLASSQFPVNVPQTADKKYFLHSWSRKQPVPEKIRPVKGLMVQNFQLLLTTSPWLSLHQHSFNPIFSKNQMGCTPLISQAFLSIHSITQGPHRTILL
ncbi:hypothetical protein OIU77_028267 [Salix suchowensis]|uniref:laccase n=1 Tax=Salix suchowensis TaxID=1278906 RepID=A0ABQ9BJ16_9ROSI|nr:hypothetical protein OIU77_028267 [Salix suchowensis]